MREAGKPATLSELMGEGGSEKDPQEWCLDDLPKILGEKMPDLPPNRIGKHRLLSALRIRLGVGYKNIRGVQNIIKQFDDKVSVANVVKVNKESRNGNSY